MAYKLELELQEVNMVLASLSKHPFEEVFVLIEKIKAQVIPQVQETEATAKAAEEAKAE
jgi:hypothetical protein